MIRRGSVFLDAGLFIGALMEDDPRHAEARQIVEAARRGELEACASVGVLAEVYAALTWAGAESPLSPGAAAEAVRALVDPPSRIAVLDTAAAAGLRMLDIAARHRLTARRIHDARHAATALVSGIWQVQTYDVDDWRAFAAEGIVIVGPPSAVASGAGLQTM
jgi:predicted nucleic acid-binding protein